MAQPRRSTSQYLPIWWAAPLRGERYAVGGLLDADPWSELPRRARPGPNPPGQRRQNPTLRSAAHWKRQPARSDGPPVRVQDINEGSHESRPASRAENGAEVTATTDEHPAAHADAAPPPHGLGPLGLGLVRPEFAEPPAHAVAARLAERAVGIGVVRTLVKEPRAVGVAVGLADGLDRVEVDGGGRRAAAVVGPLGK